MNARLELHPDLNECLLEDRCLMALSPGLYPSPFMAISAYSNQIIVPGTNPGGGGGGGNSAPGPSWYNLRLGVNLNASGGGIAGSSIGGTVSIYGQRTGANLGGGGGGGGGGGNGSSGGNAGGFGNFGGFGVSFSSGYGFALSSGNNYGMFSSTGASTTLGSVPVHNYSGGGDLSAAPETQGGAGGPNGVSPNNHTVIPPAQGYMPGLQGSNYGNRLLGKSPAAADSLLTRPAGQVNP